MQSRCEPSRFMLCPDAACFGRGCWFCFVFFILTPAFTHAKFAMVVCPAVEAAEAAGCAAHHSRRHDVAGVVVLTLVRILVLTLTPVASW